MNANAKPKRMTTKQREEARRHLLDYTCGELLIVDSNLEDKIHTLHDVADRLKTIRFRLSEVRERLKKIE